MKIIFVDDEQSAHVNFDQDIRQRTGISSLHHFYQAEDTLAHAGSTLVDCAFLDVDLGGSMNGLELAKQLKALQPNIEIAFLTASDSYTKTSYQLGGRAYLTKPYAPEELDAALYLLHRLIKSPADAPTLPAKSKPSAMLRTFGNFDLIIAGKSVSFKTAKAKEALAFLTDQMGGSVSGAQVFFALWENQEYTTTTSVYVRRTMRALKEELTALNLADILVFARNSYSVDLTKIYCDSYALLHGSAKEAHLFNGEYMKQYSWGEMTIPLLDRAAKKYDQG